jgi:E3 ubiquitin-protein ligase SHPRH
MTEERSFLSTLDARINKQRRTKAALKALADAPEPSDVPGEVAEQAAVLMKERQAFRDARVHKGCTKPLKALLLELNGEYRKWYIH